jgi:hypothetical protein
MQVPYYQIENSPKRLKELRVRLLKDRSKTSLFDANLFAKYVAIVYFNNL